MTKEYKLALEETYKQILYNYGFAVITILKHRRVEEENYEEAKMCYDILEDLSHPAEMPLNDFTDDKAIEEWKELFKKRELTGDYAASNLNRYLIDAERMLKDVQLGCLKHGLQLESLTELIDKIKGL